MGGDRRGARCVRAGGAPAVPSRPAADGRSWSWPAGTTLPPLLAAIALLLAVIAAALIWRWHAARPRQALATEASPTETNQPPDLSEQAAAASAAMIRTADSLHAAIRAQVLRLDGPELKATLLGDLATVEQRLMSPHFAQQVAAREWLALQGVLADILTDFEGIQAALDEVVADPFAYRELARDLQAMPETVAEAHALLGVNADADERIVKKVVDGLRQSWHPDLARDERDRSRREQRIKSINVAWDLISRRHQEAA